MRRIPPIASILLLALSSLWTGGCSHRSTNSPTPVAGDPPRLIEPSPELGRHRAVATGALLEDPDPNGAALRWSAKLGSEAYGGPTLAGDVVVVGTNNANPRAAEPTGDSGILMAFRRSDGEFLWQRSHAKLESGRINDWPLQGVGSTPAWGGDLLYYLSNRAEVIALDLESREPRWTYDLMAELEVFPHHLASSSPLILGDLLLVMTGNGVDESGRPPHPEAPSFAAFDRHSGELMWSSALPAAGILDGQWASPSYGVAGGRPQVIFPAGDGWIYSLSPVDGALLWKFDANSHLAEGEPKENLIASAVFYRDRVYAAVGHDPELGPGRGQLWAIDATGEGDVTSEGAVWSYAAKDFSVVLGTPAVADGRLYVADLNGFVHALDVDTGDRLWTYDTFAAIWASPLHADGKLYVGDEDGDLAVLDGATGEVLAEPNLGDSIYADPIAADGVLYVATRSRLHAFSSTD